MRQDIFDSGDRNRARDTFRHCHGFQALLDCLRSASGFFDSTRLAADDQTEFFALVNAILDVLAEAFEEHPGNRRYFVRRLDGWNTLEQALASTGVVGSHGEEVTGYEQLFGCLLAFAVGEESMRRVYRDVSKLAVSTQKVDAVQPVTEGPSSDEPSSSGPRLEIADSSDPSGLAALRTHISRFFDGNELLQNPEIVTTMVRFWATLHNPQGSPQLQTVLNAILLTLGQLISSTVYNKNAVSGSGAINILLPLLFSDTVSGATLTVLREVTSCLSEFGLGNLQNAHLLFQKVLSNDDAAVFLLQTMKSSKVPPFIQFDLSIHGYSSAELSNLGRPFPPSSSGYTFATWFKIDQFDKTCHTTIFGAYDATQTCFVLAYLEKDTHHFILQTSIESSRPSVRFKSTVFKENTWYHLALVHRRPTGKSQSKASLFVNGEFVEQVRSQYPAKPPMPTGSIEGFAAVPSNNPPPAPIQAFLGTPQDLANRLGRNVVSTRWSLASFHLFQEALSDELIAVYQKLGPRYHGNFQDHLGNFQTYRASAELHLRNESLHPTGGKGDSSDILAAIRGKAGALLPEWQILLSISPTSVLDNDDRNNIDESQLIKSLSKDAARNLNELTTVRGNALVVNAAIASINEALIMPHGVATLTGEPVVVISQSLDEMAWRLGGCAPIGLKLVELASTGATVLRAVDILLESIQDSWKNSEAMEKENGYAVLAVLLRDKLGLESGGLSGPNPRPRVAPIPVEQRDQLAAALLERVLTFVGYDHAAPENSIIINPLAYRVLLADFDTWRISSVPVQKAYYKQFVDFAKGSKHHNFNVRRLVRMRRSTHLMLIYIY